MLENIKVLDFTNLLPGPYATMMLADMGAEVVNIIPPNYIDLVKHIGIQVSGVSLLYRMLHRNKKRITMDLKTAEGMEKIRNMIESADVIIEGFRPGVMQRLGLDYTTVKKINPRLVYCSLSGYGTQNPLQDRPGHDINYQALSGLAIANTIDNQPKISQIPLADLVSGSLHAVIAILGALVSRSTTQSGQYLEVSMTDCSFALTFLDVLPFLNPELADSSQILPNHLFSGQTFYGYYRTKDSRYLSIGSLEPKFFTSLLEALEIHEFSIADQFDPAIKGEIAAKILQQPLSHWIDLFEPLDICVEPVLNLDEVIKSEYIKERELIVLSEIDGHQVYQPAHPIKYSDFEPDYVMD